MFAFVCRDKADAGDLRLDHLQAHLRHAEAYWERYLAAGPLKTGGETTGSLFLVRATDERDAWRVMERDPYVACGLYAEIVVREFTPAAGLLLGGRIWEDAP